MVLKGIALQDFRLHHQRTIQFHQPTTIIIGNNAVGKTSIIEAISLLATGDSFRANRIEEMINFQADLSRLKATVLTKLDHPDQQDELEVILTRGLVNGRKTQRRIFAINGVKRYKKRFVGQFSTVVFRPEDMRMIEGSPARRRNFLNTVLSMVYPEYSTALKNYEQTLKRRNRLLLQVREGEQPRTSLSYWNLNLVKYGQVIQHFRQQFIATFITVNFPLDFSIEYQASVISTARIDEYLAREIASGHTLVGPHKDDLVIYLHHHQQKFNLASFGSRGQQRLGVLWLKFCELEYLNALVSDSGELEQKPVLLLDDILSELDSESKLLALSVLSNYQSIITTTDIAVLKEVQKFVKNTEVIRL